MRTILLAALLLTAPLATLAPSASAQQQGVLTLELAPVETALTEGATVTIQGLATFTADATAHLGVMGIPVHFHLETAPEWLTATISPSTAVFRMSQDISPSTTGRVPFTVTLNAGDHAEDAIAILAIAGQTQPTLGGRAYHGEGRVPVSYDAPEEEEECHALTPEEKARLMQLGAEAYEAYHAEHAEPEEESDDVSVQSTGATPLAPASWALAAFGLAGAALGFLARRRFGR